MNTILITLVINIRVTNNLSQVMKLQIITYNLYTHSPEIMPVMQLD
jgi:hypothetical protein